MKFISSGNGETIREIAFEQAGGTSPGLFWLGGFKSDMQGSKVSALVEIGTDLELEVTRFDYSGHGQSEGTFLDGTISDWLEDSHAAFAQTNGPQIVVGSSMGAWLALLLNQQIQDPEKIKALILIAPAVDMTHDLMLPDFNAEELKSLETQGFASRPSNYDEPYTITKKLIDDGTKHCLFKGPIKTNCPVYILQGGKDTAVPTEHALKLVSHILLDPVFFTLVPDGDHSLSRPQDLKMLKASIERALIGEG